MVYVLKSIYSKKGVLGMIDQCHSETDIVNYILPYVIVINFKIFYNQEMAPAGGIRDPLGTCCILGKFSYFITKIFVECIH